MIQQDGHEPLAVVRIDDLFKLFLSNMNTEEEDANDLH